LSEPSLGTPDRPLRVAIVGAGPSGFYAAAALLKHKELTVEVDLIDRLPTPYGLVRGGVAPDHQKIKNVVRAYEKTANHERFRFFGNVRVGHDVTVAELRDTYDQVCFAIGAESSRRLGIDGEDLGGSHSATAFVGWYNGHPDYRDHAFDLSTSGVVVVGVGNVAMDVARVLAQDPERLASTDIADYALEALRQSKVTDIYVLGRRGPAQAAFSPAEIKEIGSLEGVDLVLPGHSTEVDAASQAWLETEGTKNHKKNVAYLQEKAIEGVSGAARRVHLLMVTSPTAVLGDGDTMSGVRIERNEIYLDDRGNPRPRGTGQTDTLEAGLMFRSVGYRGIPLPGLPYHQAWGIVPNDEGRVTEESGEVLDSLYVVGWAKRGPSGLIGTNRADSQATVAKMIEDAKDRPARNRPSSDQAAAFLSSRTARAVSWADWKRLDQLEREAGEPRGQIRRKFTSVDAMIEALD
jgi:ferredoxin--NADP+ reductase